MKLFHGSVTSFWYCDKGFVPVVISRVVRTEEDTDSTTSEMAALLEVLMGANVTENLVVMVDNQSILREISRWVDEGDRTFLGLSDST